MESKGKRGQHPPAAPKELAAMAEIGEPAGTLREPVAAAARQRGDEFARDACEALARSQEAMMRGFEALGLEFAGLARSSIDRAARTANEMLAVRTFSDAVEVNAGAARDSFDTLLDGSTRLSELAIKFAREAAQPFLAQWQRNWAKGFRF